MTPQEQEALAKARFGILTMLRASGTILMVLGIWIWLGDILRAGGWPELGLPLFIVGFAESLILTQFLTRRWRTPPQP